MPFVNVKLIEGVFTPDQKQQIVRDLTEAMVAIEGENMRAVTWVVIEEVHSGDWGIAAAYDPAQTALADGLAVAVQGPQLPAELMLRAELALLAAERGRVDEGKAELARCQEILRWGEDWRGLAGRVALAAGMLAAAEDRPTEAAEAFAAATQTFRGYACCWDEAEARCLWARALPTEAGSQREIAAGLYRSIGAGHRWATWVTRSTN